MAAVKNGREYLSHVTESLKHRIAQLDESIEAGQKEIEGMHEYYWENYTEMDQYGYENFDNQQALLHEINASNEKIELRRRFRKMMDSPFFGRVDFCYEGEDEPEIFYIGIANLAEENGGLPLIYDWRAPVSGLFYDFDKGPASYQAPLGEIHGDIAAKWQYKIRGGKMIYEFESDVKIDDEILKAELGSNGDVQLKNIIRTIQKEQNAIIRNTRDRILVIQGAAGSGKTSIALHRIAYLLYHERENLKSSNILILSPNGVFADYISHILPELGEENIREMSFDLFAYKELKNTAADCEDKYDQLERIMKFPDQEALRRADWKQSAEFVGEIEGFLAMLEDSLMDFRPVEYRGTVMTEEEILKLFYYKFTETPLLKRMDLVRDYFIDEWETLRGRNISDDDKLLLQQKFDKMYVTKDLYRIYCQLLEECGLDPLSGAEYERRKIPYEDVFPMLYLKYRLEGGNHSHKNIKHLVIDEMQDYSYLQYTILANLFSCKMTILGDRAQTMDEKQQDVLTFLPRILGRDLHKIEMNKSYRNTVEIAEYAAKISGIEDLILLDRHGKEVAEQTFASEDFLLDAVQENLNEEFETAALLTMTEEEALELNRLLKLRGAEVAYIDKNSSFFKKGLTVTTFYLAKGLEFDQVFAVRGKEQNPLRQQAEYICATRALHELYMYEIADV